MSSCITAGASPSLTPTADNTLPSTFGVQSVMYVHETGFLFEWGSQGDLFLPQRDLNNPPADGLWGHGCEEPLICGSPCQLVIAGGRDGKCSRIPPGGNSWTGSIACR